MGHLWDATLDLCLGSTCAVCQVPGRALCRRCEAELPRSAAAAWPTPTPPGLVRPSAAGEYDGALRALVLELKEHGRLSLTTPLGRLVALAVLDTCRAGQASGRIALVPVPSHPAVVRARGQDPVTRTARVAAGLLRAGGLDIRVLPLLRVAVRPADQAGLDARARARNLEGRFTARRWSASSSALIEELRAGATTVVLVDDVVTTGATLREAQRAVEEVGVVPLGAALAAATRRRRPSVEQEAGLASFHRLARRPTTGGADGRCREGSPL